MNDQTTHRAILEAALAASRAFTKSLEQALASAPATPTPRPLPSEDGELLSWDPLTDAPLVQPKVKGTRLEMDWCSLTYLGAIWATNVRYSRGADRDEIRDYAQRAGYQDGRAVTAWSKGEGATRNDDEKQRWMTDAGKRAVHEYAASVGVKLPSDLLADLPAEEQP